MKILVLANFGMGLYKFRKELLHELVKQGHEVIVSFPQDEYVQLVKELGCKYVESKVDRRGTNPITDFRLLVLYTMIIKEIKPNIVLTYTIKPNIYGGIACRLTNTPYIPNITGLGTALVTTGLMQKLTLLLYKVGLKNAKYVFFQNVQNRDFFIENDIVKCDSKVLPGSGVNLEQYQFTEFPAEDRIIQLLYIGRIMKSKGIDELLEAAKQMKEKEKSVEFHVLGFCEEEYSAKLEKLNDLGIIHYHGQKDDVHKYLKSSHAVILPSYHEGTSNVLLEAASTGRVILASNVPGCKETFDEGISGFGFEVKSVESIIESIDKYIGLPYEVKKQMGKAGRVKMEQEYDRRIVIREYLDKIGK